MRTDRIDEDIKYFLSKIIREDLKNPKITGLISITSVNTTKDLRYCKVYVSIFGTKYTHQVFTELKRSSGYVRKCLGQMLKARNIPDIVFELDDSIEYGSHMEQVLKDLKAEQ
jgi:ribosome-binding factor A